MKGVYLLHFEPAYKHARHYLGFSEDVLRRVAEHYNGTGARLTQVAHDAGCTFLLARVWAGGDRELERQLKNRKAAPALCPICGGSHTHVSWAPFTLEEVEELAF